MKMDGQRTCVCYDMCRVCESLAAGFMAVVNPSKMNITSTGEEGGGGEGGGEGWGEVWGVRVVGVRVGEKLGG